MKRKKEAITIIKPNRDLELFKKKRLETLNELLYEICNDTKEENIKQKAIVAFKAFVEYVQEKNV